MRKIFYAIPLLILLMALLLLCVSCSGDNSADSDNNEPVHKGTITLSVYNWGEYISDGSEDSFNTNAAFEEYYYQLTGQRVEVLYTTYSNNEEMYSKLSSNAGTYDVIIPSDYMIERMIAEDMLLPFDATSIENFAYISDEFKGDNCKYDPTNMYSVPYTYGMVGVIYNTSLINPDDLNDDGEIADPSWGLMWNPDYAGKILQFNNPRDAFGTAMYYKNIDINTASADEWDSVLELLKEQKPLLQAYVNDEIFNKMSTGSAAIAPYYAGDFIIMNSENEDLAFYYPKEGTNYFVDAMCIPKNARYPDVAKEYINFMLSEEPAIANALYIGYASPNTIVKNSEEYAEEMGEYAMDILYSKTIDEAKGSYSYDLDYRSLIDLELEGPDGEKLGTNVQTYLNNQWERLKTWSAVELWVHIVSITIVVAILSLCIYNIYIKKKRSRFYRYRDRAKKGNSQ